MKSSKLIVTMIIGAVALTMLACNMPMFIGSGGSSQGAESTSAAQTVEAQLTQLAGNVQPSPTPWLPTATSQPTITTAPTIAPTKTTAPTSTSAPVLCNAAQFIRDMTVPDGAEFSSGSEFVKVWRLKNIGSCTWNKSYTVTFDGGDQMGGSTVNMPENVAPGEQVDIAVEMKAPNSKGTYKGYWLLRDDDGDKFGLGGYTDKSFWVAIKVIGSAGDGSLDFATSFCNANWKSDGAQLYCQGNDQYFKNYVQFTNELHMETGKVEDEPALIVNVAEDDRVRGTYPSYTVKDGDHFIARIGCVYGSKDCKVKVVLSYQIKGTDTKGELGSWVESYDDNTTLIDIDLTSLAGKEVIFTLDVTSRSDSDDNTMFWFVPRILQ